MSDALDRSQLHDMLDALLDAADADTGHMDVDAMWEFLAALAHGRGVTQFLHAAGLEAVEDVNTSPAGDYEDRKRRAYHIGVLLQLLLGTGRLPGQPSVLPGNFQHGAVAADLLAMLGRGGTPQILAETRKGEGDLRRYARRQIVGIVLWRAGRTGGTPKAIWHELMGGETEGRTWDNWLNEVGGGSGDFARSARAAGEAEDRSSPFSVPDGHPDLVRIIELARSGPGRSAT